MDEKIFLNEAGVKVTNTRAIVDGDTYSLANVTSCKVRYTTETDSGKNFLKNLAIIIAILLGIFIGITAKSFGMGIIIVIVGIIASQFIKTKFNLYKVTLGSASGEQDAVSNRDGDFVDRIKNALDDAIVSRG